MKTQPWYLVTYVLRHMIFCSIDQGQGSYTDGNFGRAPLTAYRMPGTAQQRPPMSQMGRNNQQPPGSRAGVPVR
jgi:hypothetical protein